MRIARSRIPWTTSGRGPTGAPLPQRYFKEKDIVVNNQLKRGRIPLITAQTDIVAYWTTYLELAKAEWDRRNVSMLGCHCGAPKLNIEERLIHSFARRPALKLSLRHHPPT
jgi:hypothetical protein